MARGQSNSVQVAVIPFLVLLFGVGAVCFALRLAPALSAAVILGPACAFLILLKVLRRGNCGQSQESVPQADSVIHVVKRQSAAKSMSALEQLYALNEERFIALIAALYEQKGNRVERLEGAELGKGIGLILRLGSLELGVQCKYWKSWMVGVKEIREFLCALQALGIEHGRFVALKDFSQDAKALAAQHNIQLVDGVELVKMMAEVQWERNASIQAVLKAAGRGVNP